MVVKRIANRQKSLIDRADKILQESTPKAYVPRRTRADRLFVAGTYAETARRGIYRRFGDESILGTAGALSFRAYVGAAELYAALPKVETAMLNASLKRARRALTHGVPFGNGVDVELISSIARLQRIADTEIREMRR